VFGRKVLVVILLLLGVSWVNFAIPTPKDVGGPGVVAEAPFSLFSG